MRFFCTMLISFTSFILHAQNTANETKGSANIETVFLNIDLAAAKKIMDLNKKLVLIDVRTPEEVAQGKIGNALEMDIKAPDFLDRLRTLDKATPYMVYCHAGGRSAQAMKIMQEMGFVQVYNFDPGYRVWKQQEKK
jgi:rhodanese-related sulfurtransferase